MRHLNQRLKNVTLTITESGLPEFRFVQNKGHLS